MSTEVPIVDLRREEIEDARQMSVREKLEASGDLFDGACEVTLSVILGQNPGMARAQALDILRKRLEWAQARELRL